MSQDDLDRKIRDAERTQDVLRETIEQSVRMIERADTLLARAQDQGNDNEVATLKEA